MKQKMKNGITILLILLFSGTVSMGQVLNYVEKIESLRIGFFTERLALTPDESAKFWPVYNDFNHRREKINEDRRSLFRYLMRNSEYLSEKEINESLDKYINLQREETELVVSFNQRFLEILPPKKVLNIYVTENQFKAYILNQIKENRQGNPVPRRERLHP